MIEDASAELIDKQRLPMATLKGLNATFRDVSEKSSAGEISIGSIVAPGYATVGEIQGKTEHRDKTVTVRILAANICKGSVAGEITFAPGAPMTASLSLENVDIGLAGKEARKRMRNASGILTGNVQLAGFDRGAKALTGEGSLVLRSGRCTEIELIRQIGEILQYAALAGFEVREARANFRVASERIFLSPLDVSLHPLGMSVTGGVGFDGAVELTGLLSAPRNIVQRTGLVSAQFSPPDVNDRQSVQFDIKGTLDHPKQNLAAQLTGTKDRKLQRIIAAESILSTLFGKKVEVPKPADPKAVPPAPPAQVQP
ncbi:MAG: AsmA-like C-terminal region-containing protein [Chthoniobacteraceae bacterium]